MKLSTLVLLVVTLVLLFFIFATRSYSQIQMGPTAVVQEMMNPRVLKDGTTVYEKIDTIYRTHVGKCDLCQDDLHVVWRNSSGFKVPTVYGYQFHPNCFSQIIDYMKKKINFKKVREEEKKSVK